MSSRIDVLLIYPYFHKGPFWRKLWLFPPLGLGYLASSLRKEGLSVAFLDGTFMKPDELITQAKALEPRMVCVYCMVTMRDNAIMLARALKQNSRFLVAGGPFPTSSPEVFLDDFDAIVLGEGELTLPALSKAYLSGKEFSSIPGLALKSEGKLFTTGKRDFIKDLDSIPHPARDLFDNQRYKGYWQRSFGYSCAPLLTTRGCPYSCDYCARPVFGSSYRERGVNDIVSEIEEVLALGYERVWFSDDVFTLNKERTLALCDEIKRRNLVFSWECLCRVDNVDLELFKRMRDAGCARVFFGIESGDDRILGIMGKRFSSQQASDAVAMAKQAGISVGTFFMLGYPGETEETILKTVHFSSSLPSDYLSYTLPYPLPGTGLYKRLEGRITRGEWKMAGHNLLMFTGDFSQFKLRFAIYKGMAQHRLRKRGFSRLADLFSSSTDRLFRLLK